MEHARSENRCGNQIVNPSVRSRMPRQQQGIGLTGLLLTRPDCKCVAILRKKMALWRSVRPRPRAHWGHNITSTDDRNAKTQGSRAFIRRTDTEKISKLVFMVQSWSSWGNVPFPKMPSNDFQLPIRSHSYREVSISYRFHRFCHGSGRGFEPLNCEYQGDGVAHTVVDAFRDPD
jgi:hypothetical protein